MRGAEIVFGEDATFGSPPSAQSDPKTKQKK